MAQPPRVWLTHPLNHERDAWILLSDAQSLREQISVAVVGDDRAVVADTASVLAALASQFSREYLAPRYCGAYFGGAL